MIIKTGATICQWQKHSKGYRERAKSKIAFRDLAVGDLALFLCTRNSPLRPWAAFNGGWYCYQRTLYTDARGSSFPHYFLRDESASRSSCKYANTREWVVGRMTSILEHVVDPIVRIVRPVVWFVFCFSPFSRTQTVVPMPSQTVLGITCWRLRIGLSVVVYPIECVRWWRRRHW